MENFYLNYELLKNKHDLNHLKNPFHLNGHKYEMFSFQDQIQ